MAVFGGNWRVWLEWFETLKVFATMQAWLGYNLTHVTDQLKAAGTRLTSPEEAAIWRPLGPRIQPFPPKGGEVRSPQASLVSGAAGRRLEVRAWRLSAGYRLLLKCWLSRRASCRLSEKKSISQGPCYIGSRCAPSRQETRCQ